MLAKFVVQDTSVASSVQKSKPRYTMAAALLAIDSTGKTTGKPFCHAVTKQHGWRQPLYMPGQCLVELIKAVLRSPEPITTLCVASKPNKVVDMTWEYWFAHARDLYWKTILDLADHIRSNSVSRHLILFGADADMFEGVPHPDDYRRSHFGSSNHTGSSLLLF